PNVADTKHFEKAQYESIPVPSELVSIDKPIVGFVCAIDNFKVDFDLIEYCAVQNRDISFVLIGPVGRGDNTVRDSLPDEDNIYYLGEKAYVHLPNYLKAFDVCIIPYRLNEYTRACFPLKLQESLAAGKPLVSINLPAVKDFSEVVYVAESKEDFSRLIRQALREDSLERIKVRQKVAMENSWEKRIQEIENIMAKDMQI
ncbi:glycosyltransferase, partial [bacterium]|nr:glycosyltransferase [bacterium]